MVTIEQKVNLALRYIAATNDTQRSELKSRIIEALKDGAIVPAYDAPLDIDDLIVAFMKEVGVPAKLLGHNYLVCAVKLVVQDRTYTKQLTDRLYQDVAARCNTTDKRAERAMRHAIEVAFDRCDFDILRNIFGNTISYTRGKLTNGEFITASADEISRRMKSLGVEVV